MESNGELQFSFNRTITYNCRTCGQPIPAGEFFIRNAATDEPECVKCFETRVQARWNETRDSNDYVQGIPDACGVCGRYKTDVRYRELSRSYEWTKDYENGDDFCDDCFQKWLYQCGECGLIYPHHPDHRPTTWNPDGAIRTRCDEHICEGCHHRLVMAKQLGVEPHKLVLDDEDGGWFDPEQHPERALRIAVEASKQAYRKAGVPIEVIEAKFAAEDTAWNDFCAVKDAKLKANAEKWI